MLPRPVCFRGRPKEARRVGRPWEQSEKPRRGAPRDPAKTGGPGARARGGIPLEAESADLGAEAGGAPLREPRGRGRSSGRGRRLRRVPGGREPGAASRWGPGAGLRPARPPCWSAAAQHRPLSRAGARLVAALVARRGPGRSAPLLSPPPPPPPLPSFQQRGPVGPPRHPAPGDGKRRGRGRRLWQSFPDARIRARRCRPPVTASRRARGFLIWKKIHLVSFVKLSLRVASGGSSKLAHGGSTAGSRGCGGPRDSGARAPSGPGRSRGCARGGVPARGEEGPPGALYGGGSPEWCAPGRPKLWCPLA